MAEGWDSTVPGRASPRGASDIAPQVPIAWSRIKGELGRSLAGVNLQDALRARHSRRDFSAEPVARADRAALLDLARERPVGGWAYPSAHDLRTVTLDDVGPHIPRDAAEAAAFDEQPWLLHAPLLLVLAADLGRAHAEFDYQDPSGNQARDFVMLEAGCLLQSVLLTCADRELAAVPIAGVRRPDIDQVLGVSGHVIALVAIGHPEPDIAHTSR